MLLALLALPALAQPANRPPPPAEIVAVDFGWDGVLPPERWAPVRVMVRAGTGTWEGTLTLEYMQDATQAARIVLPIATTPGETVPFEMAACVPHNLERLRLTLAGPRVRQRIDLDQNGGDARWAFPLINASSPVVVCIGDVSAVDAFDRASKGEYGKIPNPDGATTLWDSLVLVTISPDRMALGWKCYESVEVVVARPGDLARAEPRRREALMTWVEGGGRLLLLADAPGGELAQFTGPGILELDELLPTTPGSWAPTQRPVSARAMRLTEAATGIGWRTFWPVDSRPGSSLGAVGPVGMGMVSVLGVDAARLPALVNKAESRQLWRPVLDDAIHGILPSERRSQVQGESNAYWRYSASSGVDTGAMNAIRITLDAMAGVATIGDGAFILIAAAVLLLALMVGPFDAVMLRRRRLTRLSWAFALLWIASASAMAYFAPRVVRSAQTVASRARVVDQIDDGQRRYEWTTALHGVFAGKPMSTQYPADEGSWWRGVSAVEHHNQIGSSFAPFTTIIRGSTTRSAHVPGLSQGQWTYRTALEHRPGETSHATTPRVELERTNDGFRVIVENLPPDVAPPRGALLVGANGTPLTIAALDTVEGRTTCIAEVASHALRPNASTDPNAIGRDNSTRWNKFFTDQASLVTHYATHDSSWPGAAFTLPGPRERADAAEAMLAGGRWACVLLEFTGLPDDRLNEIPDATPRTLLVMRVMVPLEEVGEDVRGGDLPEQGQERGQEQQP